MKEFKRIAFIATTYANKHDGISIYLENLLIELIESSQLYIDIYVKDRTKNKLSDRLEKNTKSSNYHFICTPNLLIKSIFKVNFLINKNKYDLVLSPNLTPSIVFLNKSLSVIHDFTYRTYPNSLKFYQRFYKRFLLSCTIFDQYIGYISNSTFTQINLFANMSKNKRFIHLPNGLPISVKKTSRICTDERQDVLKFLFVGSLNQHKGLDVALRFCSQLSKKINKNIILNLVGKETFQTKNIIDNFYKGDFELKQSGYVSDETLYKFYSQSDAILLMSRSEGFGIPLVEAAYFNLIPILSDISSFREITQNNFFYYSHERDNLSEIVDSFLKLDENSTKKILTEIVNNYKQGYQITAQKIIQLLNE